MHSSRFGHALGVDRHVRGVDRLQLQRRLGDDPGEPHPAGRCREDIRIRVGPDRQHAVRRSDELHLLDVVAERTVAELAVDVGGDGPADGHEPGARHDHREPSEGYQRAQQQVEAHTGLDRAPTFLHVEREDAIHVGEAQHFTAGVLRGVAVAAAEATREHAAPRSAGSSGRPPLRRAGAARRWRGSGRCDPSP